MLIIEGNAVYEIDCDCLKRKNMRRAYSCDESAGKEGIEVQTGGTVRKLSQYTGKGVSVAVLDTGIYPHPDFAGRITGWYDAVSHKKEPFDPNGHGTQEGGKLSEVFAICKRPVPLELADQAANNSDNFQRNAI